MSTIPPRLRKLVTNRANDLCEYCLNQQELLLVAFQIDHIVPRAQNGETSLDNLALACPLCNAAKAAHSSGYDAQTSSFLTLFNPRRQLWVEHFEWSADCTEVLGVTPVGRATVAVLDMNRPRVRLMRLRWRRMKLHPPNLPLP